MSGETEQAIAIEAGKQELQQQLPSAEPTLGQLDEWQRQLLINKCYGIIRDEGKLKEVCLYPDIMTLISSVGHLEGTTHYVWEHAQASWLDWEYTQFKPLKNKYKRDPRAMGILYEIRGIKRRQIYGDALDASRQKYVVQLSGSDKVLRLFTNNLQEKKGGWFKW